MLRICYQEGAAAVLGNSRAAMRPRCPRTQQRFGCPQRRLSCPIGCVVGRFIGCSAGCPRRSTARVRGRIAGPLGPS